MKFDLFLLKRKKTIFVVWSSVPEKFTLHNEICVVDFVYLLC